MTVKYDLLASVTPYKQEHLLAFWEQLTADQQGQLAAEIQDINFSLLDRLYRQPGSKDDIRALADRAAEPPSFQMGNQANRFSPQEATARGEEALHAGEVAVMVVAGGQGTRLGFNAPKGMYPIGPISQKSLFQIHVEKILATSKRYGQPIPFCVMTSPATHKTTVEYFTEHNRFGLPKEDLKIFCQGTMPAVDAQTGKVLLDQPGHIALSPDGHGGMLAALARSGLLNELQERGIKHLFYFQVDNPLVQIGNPEFLGYHLLSGSEMTTQVVGKESPLDRVGNVVQVDGRLHVIEYSDLPSEVAERRKPDGSLEIWAGSIAVHALSLDFLARVADKAEVLPFHVAHKKVPFISDSGERVQPEKPNAIKFERFIFDLMPWAKNSVVVQVDTDEHFAPLKNAPGEKRDTPDWVRGQMTALYTGWLRQAGAQVAPNVTVEISPLYALDAQELAQKVRPNTSITTPTYLTPNPFLSTIHYPPTMLHAVIMAGGSGTRLWPESRREWPKQLLNIQGQRTMIQATVDRLGSLVRPDQVIVATTTQLAGKIHEQLSQLPRDSILCEPCPRNTAPCIGLAALKIVRQDPDAVMAVMPADHVIEPAQTFQEALRFAATLVEEQPERLVTFGIRPTYPAESFGYIEREEPLVSRVAPPAAHSARAYRVKKFHEKPKREVAQQYVEAGNTSWNSGIFLWKAQTILTALARYQPRLHEHLQRIDEATGSDEFAEVLDREFAAIEGISIDYAVMERSPDVVMIEAPFAWDDVGSWRSLERLCKVDAQGNLLDAPKHLAIDTTGSIVRSQDPNHLVVLLGVNDLIVIHTPKATLVADKSQEESIRKVIRELDSRGWREYL